MQPLPTPFYRGTDHLGAHAYFRSLKEAQTYAAANGGYIAETTPGRIWRVTHPGPAFNTHSAR